MNDCCFNVCSFYVNFGNLGPGSPPDQIRVLVNMGDEINAVVTWLPPKITNGQIQVCMSH